MKIACDNCGGVIAHVYGDSTIELVRQGHKITSVGKDYTVFASCPNTGKCSNKVALVIENGKLILDNLTQKGEPVNENEEATESSETSEPGESEAGGTKEKDGEESSGDGEGDNPDNGTSEGGSPESGDGAEPAPTGRRYTRV